ncbi:hypothetical protein ILYODFUR_000713 [Ilyodon furcidens]|uniref:Uncharacterized protein n=1 Tax=Ilyodon furcidens TaxID=33524 RepID=A0ABV0UMV0_9TELE
MFLRRQKPELTDHSSLNFGFGSRSFLDKRDYLCLVGFVWILFPSIKLAASCFPPSPEPRQKRNLSILPHKYLNIGFTPELTRTHSPAQVKPSGFLRYAHLGPDSLYPWRPDYTHLVSHLTVNHNYFSFIPQHYSSCIHQFSSPSFHTVDDSTVHVPVSLLVNKTPFTDSVVLLSVLLYVGQIYLEQNDRHTK